MMLITYRKNMAYVTIGRHRFDPDDSNVVTCAVCGERFDRLDCEKVADEWLCPSCYQTKWNKWNRLVWREMDEYDQVIMKNLLEEI